MSAKSRQTRLEIAQFRVIDKARFFAAGVSKLPVRFTDDPGCPTACTDGREIVWNGAFFDGLDDRVLPTVLCHEVCHCMLGHLWRSPDGADGRTWNEACVPGYVPIQLWNGTSARADQIHIGDSLYTPFGKATISRVIRKRADRLVRLRTANTRTLICTPDHPIVTADGRCAAAVRCRGSSVLQTVDDKGSSILTQELVEAFRCADRHHIRAHLQNLFRASEEVRRAAHLRWITGARRYDPIDDFEKVATWLFGGHHRRGRNDHGNYCEYEKSDLLPSICGYYDDVRFVGSGAGWAGFLPHKMQKRKGGRVYSGLNLELEWLLRSVQSSQAISDYQKAAVRIVAEAIPTSLAARLLGKPAWLGNIPTNSSSASGFERQKVIGVEEFGGTEDVYDFATDIGCYVAAGILVHNCDHATNLMLKEFSALSTGAGKVDPFPFPEPADSYLANPAFAGLAEEQIYARLARPQSNGGGQGQQQGKAGGAGSSGAGQSAGQPGKTPPKPGAGAKPAPHSMPSLGDFTPPTPSKAGQSSTKALQNDWTATLLQAAAMAAQFGTAPGSLSRFVNGLVSPVVPWTQVLRSWLREQCCDDWNWLEPALEYDGSGFILPSLKSERMGAVVFASDWSGSTYGELVEMFHVEKQACLDDMRPSRLVDLAFDTRVISAREYVPGDQIDPEIKGGGGTDFRPLIAYCEAMQPAPKCVVVLTDLDGAFPDESPSFPVIWVTFGQTAKAPFGEVIRAGGDV